MTKFEIDAIPACFEFDPFMTFAEVVWHAQIELDLISEGQEAADNYTKREVKQIKKFVEDNRASLKSLGH